MKTTTLDTYIVNIIKEGLKATLQNRALQEKEKQNATSNSQTEEKKDVDGESEKLKKGDISVDDIVEKLNSIRAGRSFGDAEVAQALKEYFDDLENPEKVALLAFLKGISQIVTGEISGAVAINPKDRPADVEMKKVTGKQSVSIKPNVIKAPDIESNKKAGSENTAGPVPITPKKK